jgi:hypothetical protein
MEQEVGQRSYSAVLMNPDVGCFGVTTCCDKALVDRLDEELSIFIPSTHHFLTVSHTIHCLIAELFGRYCWFYSKNLLNCRGGDPIKPCNIRMFIHSNCLVIHVYHWRNKKEPDR